MAGKTTKRAPGQPLTAAEKREMRRRRARRRAVLRVVVLVALCAVLVLLWQNWDSLAPGKLFNRFQDLMGSSTGSYPVDLSGVSVRRLDRSQNYSVLLTDSHLIYLNSDGAEVNRHACSYSTALLRTAGRYVLVAEQGGRRLQLSTRSAVVTELTVDQDIITVALNERGQMAVLTHGLQGYAVQVKVYDRNGKLLYTRSRNHAVTEVALSRDGSQMALLSVESVDGTLNTLLDVFSLETADTGALCSYTAQDTLLYRMEYMDGHWLVAFSEDSVVMLDTADGLAAVYKPQGLRVLGYAVSEETLALALRAYGDTGDGEVQVVGKTGEPSCSVAFTGTFRHLAEENGQYILLTDAYAQRITTTGAAGTAQVGSDGQQVVLDGDHAVVLGLNRLVAFELE